MLAPVLKEDELGFKARAEEVVNIFALDHCATVRSGKRGIYNVRIAQVGLIITLKDRAEEMPEWLTHDGRVVCP
jgi:hypothetical protein